jgi:hypothetical protein
MSLDKEGSRVRIPFLTNGTEIALIEMVTFLRVCKSLNTTNVYSRRLSLLTIIRREPPC